MARDIESGRKLVYTWAYMSTEVENFSKDVICFKNYFIPKKIII